MGFLSFIPIIGTVLKKGLDIIDKFVEDKDKANELKAAITTEVLVNQHDEIMKQVDAQMQIILAEARGGWLQRNWRPILMLVIVAIVANNYILYPYFSLFGAPTVILDLPDKLWNLMIIGVGGYIAGRTGEK